MLFVLSLCETDRIGKLQKTAKGKMMNKLVLRRLHDNNHYQYERPLPNIKSFMIPSHAHETVS